MKRRDVISFLEENKIEKDKFSHFEGLKIKLKSGREIQADFRKNRLCFSKNFLKIQYGTSDFFGGRLTSRSFIHSSYKDITFELNSGELPISMCGNFRGPEFGDIFRVSDGDKIISEAVIVSLRNNLNKTLTISLSKPINFEGRYSFYDPIIAKNSYACPGNIVEGLYTILIPNQESISKKELIHEKIKYKNIVGLTYD